MPTAGEDTNKWCSYLVWSSIADFKKAQEIQQTLHSDGDALVSWVHPPAQPECDWIIPVASEARTPAQIEEVLAMYQEEFQLYWEGPYYNNTLEENVWYPKKCVSCGGPTHYKYRSIEFQHPDPENYAKPLNIPDDFEMGTTLLGLQCYGPFVYLCFKCLEGYIGDNEMTTGGTGLWMAS